MCSMLSGSQAMMAAGMTGGMPTAATGMGGMGMGMSAAAAGMNPGGMSSQNGMSPAAAFWQARQMAANNSHAAVTANQYNPHHGMGTNHQQHHDAKMAEKIVSELQYLMTKTAAMHLQGRGGDLGAHHQGGLGGMVGGGGVSGANGSLNGGLSAGSASGRGGAGEVKPHQCQQCLKAFSSNHQLVQHIRVHTGEKPYKCSYCDRRFKQLSHVQQHTRLHTGERPYKCHVIDCGRAFIQLSNLQQHLRNHESQIERLKNRPFHCNICGKGFATESSLRTHNGKHTALVGGPNPACCPLCQKLCVSGESLMEHMKYVHKDPNASGVPAKRRNANHPCPVCGKFYVNEGSLRKHLACHPEMANQLSSSLRMWPCTVCTAVFTHENGLLAHMDQMRMDPKHQFAAQYVLTRAANERREREALLAAGLMNMSHFAMTAGAGLPGLGGSPSGHSDSSTRISTPAETKFSMGGSIGGISSAADVDMKSGGGNGSGTDPRSPLSLAHHHHAAAAAFNYERAMMGSHAAVTAGLGVGSSAGTVAANSTNTNGELNGGVLRITTANNENGLNNDQQLLSPAHDQQQAAAVAHQQAVAAAVAAQHHQHPHQQQQQVAQQDRSSERGFLYQQQQQQQMRLDSHRSSELSSLRRGRSIETESNAQHEHHHHHHNRHHSNSNSDNSHETTIDNQHQHQNIQNNETHHLNKSNLPTNTTAPPPYIGTNPASSDNPIRNPYNGDQGIQNVDHQTHHLPNNRHNPNSKALLSTEINTDDEDEERHHDPENKNEPNNGSYHSSSSILSAHPNHGTSAYNYAAGANEILNRYCLEQTIRHLHEFQDVRNLSTAAGNSMSGSATSVHTHLPSHQTS